MILSITSSTDFFSVGLFDKDTHLLGEFSFFTKKLQKSGLMAVETLLKSVDKSLKDLTEIAVDTGPGMFTGLRIGIAMAKTLSFSLQIPMREVNSLDLIRFHIKKKNKGIITALDGKQGKLFVKIFYPDGSFSPVMDITPEGLEKIILDQNLRDFFTIGNGFISYPELKKNSENNFPYEYHYPSTRNMPFAWSQLKRHEEIQAHYYRKTQAEENRNKEDTQLE